MHIPESGPQRSAGKGPHNLTLYLYFEGTRPVVLSKSPNDTGVMKAGSEILHRVGDKPFEVLLGAEVDPFDVVGAEVAV